MPAYSFQLAPFLASRPVSVRAVGSETVVASGVLDSDATFTATLDVGDYIATATDGRYTYRSSGSVDQGDPDRLADALTPNSADTTMATILGNPASASSVELSSTYAPARIPTAGPVIHDLF